MRSMRCRPFYKRLTRLMALLLSREVSFLTACGSVKPMPQRRCFSAVQTTDVSFSIASYCRTQTALNCAKSMQPPRIVDRVIEATKGHFVAFERLPTCRSIDHTQVSWGSYDAIGIVRKDDSSTACTITKLSDACREKRNSSISSLG